jgi:putative sigma-54 modulation protein
MHMKFIVSRKNASVSDKVIEKAKKKIGKFEKFFRPETETHLTFNIEKDRCIFEVTILSKGTIIRAEECTDDMYASIDLAVEKLERQIRKHKTRLGKKIRQEAMVPENYELDEKIEEDEEFKVVKTKRFPLKPMDIEEAILQMNLLGHTFFVFTNAETEKVNVIYRRNDGKYGLIEPEA